MTKSLLINLLACVGVLVAGSHASARETPAPAIPYPLLTVPPGWVYLQGELYEMLGGAYRDCSSGAFVEMAISSPAGTRPWAAAAAQGAGASVVRGERDGIPYELVRSPQKCRSSAGSSAMCERLVLSYSVDAHGTSWNFSSVVAEDQQKQRALELIFDRARLVKLIPPGALVIPRLGVVTEPVYESLTVGDSWERIRPGLGPNVFGSLRSVEVQAEPGWFDVFLDVEGKARTVELAFDSGCRLKGKGDVHTRQPRR